VTSTSLDREIKGRLGEHEIRYTRGRRSVVSALAGSDGPRSVAALHTQIGLSLPLSSLYRTLSILEETGVVVHHFGASGVTRYELAEWLQGHHHHLVCTNCGSVDDVSLSRSVESRVDALVDEMSAVASFSPSDHELEIHGLCSRCQ
jgi:Fur family ferric uptake transcriptional regulator